MTEPLALAAVDLGASSGRVMLGRIGAVILELSEVHRFRRTAPFGFPTASTETASASTRIQCVDDWVARRPHRCLVFTPLRDARTANGAAA